MARDPFNPITGGLISSVVAGFGNELSTGIMNLGGGVSFSTSPSGISRGNPNPATPGYASFGINSLLSSTVQNLTGYALNSGENYLMSQLGSLIPNDMYGDLGNAVVTQIAAAGINQISGFVSQAIPSLGGVLGGNITTAGLGGLASRGSISIPDSVVQDLPQAEYGGSVHTLTDIVFTLVPANAGAQTMPQPQSSPLVPLDVAFDSNNNFSPKALGALKSAVSYSGPAMGVTSKFDTNAFPVVAPLTSAPILKAAW